MSADKALRWCQHPWVRPAVMARSVYGGLAATAMLGCALDWREEPTTEQEEPPVTVADSGADAETPDASPGPMLADGAPPALASAGQACQLDADCVSGHCVDEVCCNTACEDTCMACNLPGSLGSCELEPADTPCGAASCVEGQATPAPRCDDSGACVTSAPQSCGAYACEDEQACATHCADDGDCRGGNVCAAGSCAPPSCNDGVRTLPETDVDCGGGDCPLCGASQECEAGSDCESGTCDGGTCTEPTYTWQTTAFGACSAGACSEGVQTRTVWCQRSDGSTVDDALCAEARPAPTRSCTNTAGCSWYAGPYGACSARCGSGSQARQVLCVDGVGAPVPSAWCAGTPPRATTSCNTHPCVVYVVGEPTASMGPCWSPPTCHGGYPAFPACPTGYTATRSETACGNPNYCGDNWALCIFAQTVHYGCADTHYVMGVASRECTYQ
jgi:hypothetical protein